MPSRSEQNSFPARYLSRIRQGSIHLVAPLAALGIAAVARAGTATDLGEYLVSTSTAPSTRAMATIDFYDSGTLEATIDVISFLPGEQGNGLEIGFAESALGAYNPGTNVIGNARFGYLILINTDSLTSRYNEMQSVTYDDIMYAIDSIAEVTASFGAAVVDSEYDWLNQDPPPKAVLTGGADTVVPEPSALTLATALSTLLGTGRRRFITPPTA